MLSVKLLPKKLTLRQKLPQLRLLSTLLLLPRLLLTRKPRTPREPKSLSSTTPAPRKERMQNLTCKTSRMDSITGMKIV